LKLSPPVYRATRKAPLLAALLLAFAASTVMAAELRVRIDNVTKPGATVYLALYDNAGDFAASRQGIAGQFLRADGGEAAATFLDVKPGRYAIAVFCDENGNGKLDTNLLGVPIERVGFSQDAQGAFGPPSFDAAAFDVADDVAIVIHLH